MQTLWYISDTMEKKALKNTDLKPLKIADVFKKLDFWWFSV